MSKKTSKRKKIRRSRKKRIKKNPSKNENRDWSRFNKRIAALRGPTWRKKLKVSRLTPEDSMLKMERSHQNISQTEIARRVGLKYQTSFARIEQRKSPAKGSVAGKIAKALNVRVKDLFSKVPHKDLYYAI